MEDNNRYTGKRWVSREERENQGRSYDNKKKTGEKRDSYTRESNGSSYRSNGYKKDGNGDTQKSEYRYNRDGKTSRDSRDQNKEYRTENKGYRSDRSADRGYDKKYSNGDGKSSYRYKDGHSAKGRNTNTEYKKNGYEQTNEETEKIIRTREQAVTESNASQAGGDDVLPFLIIGRNAVREAIKSERSIDKILVIPDRDGSLNEILTLAYDKKLMIRDTDRKKLDEICMPFGHGGKTANHQGIVAYAAGMEYCTVADILKVAKEKNEDPFIVVLDGVEDPHNLGSIIRSAECAGAHGVVIGKRRSASVTAAAVKAAAGATAYMKVARVTNVTGALEEMKRNGLWVAGADMTGVSMHEQGMNGPLAIVIGGEGGGLTKLVKETCDFLISIPMKGQINSLNASVAAAVLMFEKKRQDALKEE